MHGSVKRDTRPDKAHIRRAFERAAASYDGAAAVQRRVCHALLGRLPMLAARRVLDAGCGTGYALPLLRGRFPVAEVLALDLSAAMLARVDPACPRLGGDLERLPLRDASLDLYWSSLAAQWCDLAAVLGEARRTLRPGGALALATLGPATFGEVRHAFAGIDAYRHTLPFGAADTALALARQAGFAQATVQRAVETAHYPDFRALLKAVKAIGANQVGDGRRPGLMSRTAFAQAELAAEALRTADGLPLTYDVIYLLART